MQENQIEQSAEVAAPVSHTALIDAVAAEFRHVGEMIRRLWNTPECDVYLDSLLLGRDPDVRPPPDRPAREGRGFPKSIFGSLLQLRDMHPNYRQYQRHEDADPWKFR